MYMYLLLVSYSSFPFPFPHRTDTSFSISRSQNSALKKRRERVSPIPQCRLEKLLERMRLTQDMDAFISITLARFY